MSPRLKLYVLIIIFMMFRYIGFTQDIHFTIVDPPKDAPWIAVLDITQDPQGYLWMATDNGLNKYDGHQYTIYRNDSKNPNSISPGKMEKVYADKNGIIWIATYTAGLDRFDPATNTFTHYRHQSGNARSLANDTVRGIIEDHQGIIWIGTNGGLDNFDPKTGIFKHFVHHANDPTSLSNSHVRALYEDKKGTIWVGTGSPWNVETAKGEGGLNRLDRKTGKFTRYLHDANDPHSLTDNRVLVIFEDSHGTFWVGTAGDGLHTMDRGKGTFERHLYDPAHPEKLSRPPLKKPEDAGVDDHITFINEDVSGKIWIGTYVGGINVYDPLTKKTAWYGNGSNSKQKIGRNEFWALCKTNDGLLWIATFYRTELYKINPYQNKLPYNYMGKAAVGFIDDANGGFWMTTSKGLVHKTSDNTQETFHIDKKAALRQDPLSTKDVFLSIVKDIDNKLWLSSFNGLYLFDPVRNSFTGYHHQGGNANSLLSDSTYFLKKGKAGKLWIGTSSGLDLMDIKTKTFKHFRNDPKDTTSISSNAIINIESDNNSAVWVATYKGINKLDEKTGHFKRYLANLNVTLLNDSRGNLWAATNNGLYKYNENIDNFSIFSLEGLAVSWFTEDHEKNLWLATNSGLIKLNLQNKETSIYGKSQGVNADALTSGYVRPNGEILFGDTSGYFAFQPGELLHRAPAPNTNINRFLLADVPVAPTAGGILTKPVFNTKEINLNYNQSTFSFGFTSIDYVSEEGDKRVFYMLQNYDSKWRKAGSEEIANYYDIPPGNYIFKVKSINVDGLVAEKHIDIIISPPWWQKWWAYVLFALLFIGSVWGFIHYRSLSLIKEKRILEHKVHVRTEEVLQQKEEIEAQRDHLEKAFGDLKSAQTQLIQSEKMASLGELTAGIAHEIQNPLNFVNNFSDVNEEMLGELEEELNKGDIAEAKAIAADIRENERKINHHGKRADFIVKGMLQHSRTSTGERQPTNINTLADEFFRLSYHGLRAKDKSFNAELTTHFDENLPKVNVVQQDMGRVLLNLFNNAFYAVKQKVKTSGADYKPGVTVTTTSANGQVIIKVKDNGVGIPDAIKEKILQPFFTTKPTGEGTGLGLSLSYDILVKGHSGTLDILSKEGEGSEFIVKLPVG
ncbi:two-component regulator propeller domain-containing protein [Mucilaginibacter sp. McL0603]|uniref:two-component regulator propeller domain-containing protein n=1 Tax=Mucilaginibacter sp. McL0603 TaxID=3415670 RepID=UPI003CE7FE3E